MARHALLLLALFVAGAVAEESDGVAAAGSTDCVVTAAGAVTGNCCLAGYEPSTKKNGVDNHALAVLDIKEIEGKLGVSPPDYAGAKVIYATTGMMRPTTSGFKKFASDYGIKSAEPLGKMYTDYPWDPQGEVTKAIDGTAPYAALTGGTDDARKQVIKKTLKFQVLQMYAFHEIESAVFSKYNAGATQTDKDNAVHAWDEFWAFYAGKLEVGTGSGYGPYILGEKRSKHFGTNTKSMKNGGKSAVNEMLLRATIQGRDLILGDTDQTTKLQDIAKCMRAQIKVPLIQGCLLYAHKTDLTSKYNNGATPTPDPAKTFSAKAKAEMWAFCSGLVPFIKGANCTTCAAAAAAIDAQATFATTPDSTVDQTVVINALTPAVLNAMGVSCAMVGKNADMPGMTAVCTDTTACTATSCEGGDYMCTQDKTKCADSGKCSVVDAYDAAKLCDMPVAAAPPTTTPMPSASSASKPTSSPFFFAVYAGVSMLAVTFAAAGW
jgi:hypothetical protein